MPAFMRDALNSRGLMDAYHARPSYQRNDYIGSLRVTRAKLEATKKTPEPNAGGTQKKACT